MMHSKTRERFSFLDKYSFARDNLILELLLIALMITPLLNVIDIGWMFTHTLVDQWLIVHTPLPFKLLKDAILILVILFSLKKNLQTSRIIVGIFVALCFVLSCEIMFSYYQYSSIGLTIAGARWFAPLFLFPLLYNSKISLKDFLRFIERYRIIIFITFILQILQTMFSTRWGECSGDGCRASGFFAMPQPQALFSLFFLFFSNELPSYKWKKRGELLAVLSVILTKSGAGFLGLALYFFNIAPKKLKFYALIMSSIPIALFPFVTGRGTFWNSPKTRLGLLLNSNFKVAQFGTYTNTCFNLNKLNAFNDNICKMPDSFLVSLLGNLGLYIGALVLFLIFYVIFKSKKYNYFGILIILLMGGSYTEYFPIFLFLPFLINLKLVNNE